MNINGTKSRDEDKSDGTKSQRSSKAEEKDGGPPASGITPAGRESSAGGHQNIGRADASAGNPSDEKRRGGRNVEGGGGSRGDARIYDEARIVRTGNFLQFSSVYSM